MSGTCDLERVAFLRNYVPRQCGIATFTHDLYRPIAEALPDADCYLGAVTDQAKSYDYPEEVRFEFQDKDLSVSGHSTHQKSKPKQ